MDIFSFLNYDGMMMMMMMIEGLFSVFSLYAVQVVGQKKVWMGFGCSYLNYLCWEQNEHTVLSVIIVFIFVCNDQNTK